MNYEAEEISSADAERYFSIAKEYNINADFVKHGDNVVMMYPKSAAEIFENAKQEYMQDISEAEDFTVLVTDNTITMNIEKLTRQR